MEYPLYNQSAENVGKVELPDAVFGLDMNRDLLHQVVTSQMANQRQVIAHAKGRSEVRGGGKKPWRQKGTGRARHGSSRSPIWKGGGVTFGPSKERNFKKKINKKMAKKALYVALSSKVKDKQVVILDKVEMANPKTREMAAIFKNISKLFLGGRLGSALLITPNLDKNIKLSARNLPSVSVTEARSLNAMEVLAHKNLFFIKDSIDILRK